MVIYKTCGTRVPSVARCGPFMETAFNIRHTKYRLHTYVCDHLPFRKYMYFANRRGNWVRIIDGISLSVVVPQNVGAVTTSRQFNCSGSGTFCN